MGPHISRRQLLASSIGGSLIVLSGCNELRNNSKKPIEVTIFNVTEEGHEIDIEVLDENTKIVEQDAEIAAAEPNDGTRIETRIWLEAYPEGSTLNVRVTLDQDVQITNTIKVDCRPKQQGEDIIVRIVDRSEVKISDSCI